MFTGMQYKRWTSLLLNHHLSFILCVNTHYVYTFQLKYIFVTQAQKCTNVLFMYIPTARLAPFNSGSYSKILHKHKKELPKLQFINLHLFTILVGWRLQNFTDKSKFLGVPSIVKMPIWIMKIFLLSSMRLSRKIIGKVICPLSILWQHFVNLTRICDLQF